jgi:hypothetical protein
MPLIGIEDTTWFDQRPHHRVIPARQSTLKAIMDDMIVQYNEAFNLWESDVIDNPTLEKVNEKMLGAIDDWKQSNHESDDCTCTPNSDACPACKRYLHDNYGDEIPF